MSHSASEIENNGQEKVGGIRCEQVRQRGPNVECLAWRDALWKMRSSQVELTRKEMRKRKA